MIVTLLTDFGTTDFFVGAMKGALLSVCPNATIVDITHDITAHDIQAAAFTLLAVYQTFPAGTVHVAVVDPGVGSSRRAVLAVTRNAFFIAPDNGLLTYCLEREADVRLFHLTNARYHRSVVSPTFHGRDVFAPVAGAILNGVPPEELGDPVAGYERLTPSHAERRSDGAVLASIVHIDRFGNCITNLTPTDLPDEVTSGGAILRVGGCRIAHFHKYFSEGTDSSSEPFAIWGSTGYLELCVFGDSAARIFGLHRGQEVVVESELSE